MTPLEVRISYKFRNSLLLAEALTHPSLGYETQRHHFDNQRLEFLGDAVLQLVFTEHLFNLFPNFSEGQLTKMRSRLVSREGLKVHAIAIGLGNFLMMGKGEESSGGRVRASALADAFEALVGAMYLDGGLEAVVAFAQQWIMGVEAEELAEQLRSGAALGNYKSALQERLQADGSGTPVYRVKSESGPDHRKRFLVEVRLKPEAGEPGKALARGTGSTKKNAEQDAARKALALLTKTEAGETGTTEQEEAQ